MKRRRYLDFLTVTLFAGVLLSFLIYIGVGIVMDRDGGSDEEDGFNLRFHRDSVLTEAVKFIDYRIFGHIQGDNLIIGRDEWLFEAVDSSGGYERLLDYIGGSKPSEAELDAVADAIGGRHDSCLREGMEYMLIVVPDSITVCSDKVPWYLGEQSEYTRLSVISEYLSQRGVDSFVDPTQIMKELSGQTAMYNNTENSLNAYGAYCIYNTVLDKYIADTGEDIERVRLESADFYTRQTDGRRITQMAGVSHIISNKTVSLTDNMPDAYDVTYNEKGLMITQRRDIGRGIPRCVIVEGADSWDRAQLQPYFSNTFDRVYYRDALTDANELTRQYGAVLVVQIIHESELDSLMR